MSFQDVDDVIKSILPKVPGFDAGTLKLVLICIAQHTNGKRGDHTCFPSLERLSEMTGFSQSVCSRAVDALSQIGAFKNHIRGGGRLHSTYVLDMFTIQNSTYAGTEEYRANFEDTVDLLEISSESQAEKNPALLQKIPAPTQKNPALSVKVPSLASEEPNRFIQPSHLTSNLTQAVQTRTAATPPVSVPPLKERENPKQEKPGNPSRVSGVLPETGKVKSKTNPDSPLCFRCKEARPYPPATICIACKIEMAETEEDDDAKWSKKGFPNPKPTANQIKYGNPLGVPEL